MYRLIHLLIPAFLILGCAEKKPSKKTHSVNMLIKIKKIQPDVSVLIDTEKAAELGISLSTLQYKIQSASADHKVRTVKAAQQLVITGANGKRYRLADMAEVSLRIAITYEEPFGTNPFNIY